jgi:hypothetical protein
LYDKFGIPFEKFQNIKLSKLYEVAIFAKDKEHAEELLVSAETLAPGDWKHLEHTLQGKPTVDDGHRHDFKKFRQCKICGEKEPINEK